MYSKIVVPLDGSPAAEAALAHAAALARGFGASLTLLRAIVDESGFPSSDITPVRAETSDDVIGRHQHDEARAEAERYVEQQARALRNAGAAEVSTCVVDAPAGDAILKAGAEPGSLIVMTSFGQTASKTLPHEGVFGGVADSVLRRSRAAVLLVRP